MRKIVCDKCRRDDLAPLRSERFGVEIKMPDGVLNIDLCERCAARLKSWCKTPDDQDERAAA